MADPVFLLAYLFREGKHPPCLEAANANDDGALDVADGIFVLTYIFREGNAPPVPFPSCAPDPDPTHGFGCAAFPPCGH